MGTNMGTGLARWMKYELTRSLIREGVEVGYQLLLYMFRLPLKSDCDMLPPPLHLRHYHSLFSLNLIMKYYNTIMVFNTRAEAALEGYWCCLPL